MAVVSRDQTTNAPNTSGGRQKPDLIEVDLEKILAMGSVGPKRTLDATEDAWERSAPILPGRYTCKVFISKEKPKMGFYDEAKKEPWFTLSLECKIQSSDPEINNVTVFGGVSTRINQRKNISTAAGLIAKYGFKLPAEASDIEIVKLLRAALAKERPIDIEVDWKGGYKEADGSWVNSANTYSDFPLNPEGGRDFVIKAEKKDKSKEEVRARTYIVHWYGKDEATIVKKEDNPLGKVNGVGGLVMPSLEDDETPSIPGLVANPEPAKQTKATPAPKVEVSDDDALAALLEG